MSKSLDEMARIMAEKQKEIALGDPLPLDAEGKALAEKKRLTFDTLTVDVDPLR